MQEVGCLVAPSTVGQLVLLAHGSLRVKGYAECAKTARAHQRSNVGSGDFGAHHTCEGHSIRSTRVDRWRSLLHLSTRAANSRGPIGPLRTPSRTPNVIIVEDQPVRVVGMIGSWDGTETRADP
jgi:hypothetical protein